VVLSGNGKAFSSGLDCLSLSLSLSLFPFFLNLPLSFTVQDPENILTSTPDTDFARKAFNIRRFLLLMQDSFSSIEQCKQPVIAAVHNACMGAGVDLLCACDIRYASKDAFFSIKEVDVGLASDIGTLQRMPKIVGNEGLVRELAYTARHFSAQEALQFGFVTRVLDSRELMLGLDCHS